MSLCAPLVRLVFIPECRAKKQCFGNLVSLERVETLTRFRSQPRAFAHRGFAESGRWPYGQGEGSKVCDSNITPGVLAKEAC